MRGKVQRAPGRKAKFPAQRFFAAGLLLHDLCHEAAHGLRCLILHLPGGMGVGAEGEARVVVA